MEVITTVAAMKAARRALRDTVGFVPTMGYLHEGHVSLVKRARAENAVAVVSIFVNPTQFLPGEDYRSYPRDTERDLKMLTAAGAGFVFMPPPEEMYPAGFDTWVDLGKVTQRLEGASRPGHFKGVATVVAKLFNIVAPDKAYFGQKDAQQCVVVKKMAADLDMDLEVVICPTLREPDGLAMSSRNVYLTPPERRAAPVLYKSLMLAKDTFDKGERDAGKIRAAMLGVLNAEPLGKVDYVSIADAATMEELDRIEGPAVVSLAFRLGRPRLIDNILLG
jgi:pantoate--beta-alanine ligase